MKSMEKCESSRNMISTRKIQFYVKSMEIGEIIKGYASEDAEIISGYVADKSLQDSIHVTVVLTGLDQILDASSNGENNLSGQFPELDKPITSRNKDLFEDLPAEGDDQIPFLDVPSFLKSNRG